MNNAFRIGIAVFALNFSAVAQVPPPSSNPGAKPPDKAPPPKREFEVFSLKYSGASEVSNALNELFNTSESNIRIVSESVTNSLLIQASTADFDAIRAVLAKIDVARPEENGKVRLFQLKNIEPDKAFEDALNVIARGLKFSLDKQRKIVLFYATKQVADEIESVLSRLEEQARQKPPPDVQVRVVWLMDYPTPAKGDAKADAHPRPDEPPAPPSDLQGLLPELSKLGIGRPRLDAQTLVSVTPGSEFRSAGQTLYSNYPFSLEGRYVEKGGSPSLRLTIRAKRWQPDRSYKETDLIQTEISAPLGHLVVLGMAPLDTTTSVFVVQVLRPKDPGR